MTELFMFLAGTAFGAILVIWYNWVRDFVDGKHEAASSKE